MITADCGYLLRAPAVMMFGKLMDTVRCCCALTCACLLQSTLRLWLILVLVFCAPGNVWAAAVSEKDNGIGRSSWGVSGWEAGRLDYAYGGSEVAAFINTREQIQLQVVLCSYNEANSYRMSVLLPHEPKTSGIIPVKLHVDGTVTHVYAEVSGNALEFQIGTSFLITLPDSPTFELEFTKEDASYLNLPRIVAFPMDNARIALTEVARSCRLLCDKKGFDCSTPLISGILWPRNGFNSQKTLDALVHSDPVRAAAIREHEDKQDGIKKADTSTSTTESSGVAGSDSGQNGDSTPEVRLAAVDLDQACLRYPLGGRGNHGLPLDTLRNRQHVTATNGLVSSIHEIDMMPLFVLTDQCRAALDRVYERTGKDALFFLPRLFHDPAGAYQRYSLLWNSVIMDMARMDFQSAQGPREHVDDYDYYLTLYTLFSNNAAKIRQFPQSYYDILNLKQDPSSFLYGLDNRYELETVKYSSVLMRRLTGVMSPQRNAEEALVSWYQFYQELSSNLPAVVRAQALRPVIYRQMLMRVWRMAGYPEALQLRPGYAFVQGTNGHPVTSELLEAKCSVFEGSNGDQFFFDSPECSRSVATDLRNLGYINEDYDQMLKRWDDYVNAWDQSVFCQQGKAGSISQLRSGITLPLLSLYRIYGFGDYFLLRKCISSRDVDICTYDRYRNQEVYISDLRKTIANIAEVSRSDARELKKLNDLWQLYFDSLCAYTDHLAAEGRIPEWRARFVQGVAITIQSEIILNNLFPGYLEAEY